MVTGGQMAEEREEAMKGAFQGIIDNTEELIETIGKMDWERIEKLGTNITDLASTLKVLSRIN